MFRDADARSTSSKNGKIVAGDSTKDSKEGSADDEETRSAD
jgi:hypothetical protein